MDNKILGRQDGCSALGKGVIASICLSAVIWFAIIWLWLPDALIALSLWREYK